MTAPNAPAFVPSAHKQAGGQNKIINRAWLGCPAWLALTVLSLDAIVPRVPSAILRLVRDAQPDALAVNSADVAKEDVHIAHHTACVWCVGGWLLLVAELVPRKAADRVGVARVDAATALSAEVREDEVRVVKGEVGV